MINIWCTTSVYIVQGISQGTFTKRSEWQCITTSLMVLGIYTGDVHTKGEVPGTIPGT